MTLRSLCVLAAAGALTIGLSGCGKLGTLEPDPERRRRLLDDAVLEFTNAIQMRPCGRWHRRTWIS